MSRERFLRTLRLLAECFQAFEQLSGRHVRTLGLTPAQFDIIATLGNTPGMTFKELGEQTLITKGTLTGVIDRLEEAGLVKRVTGAQDRRTFVVTLTRAGEKTFRQCFALHIAYLKQAFESDSSVDMNHLDLNLGRLRDALRKADRERLAAPRRAVAVRSRKTVR